MRDKRLNILVTGANGQLGRCLRDAAKDSENRYVFTDICDLPGLETVHLDACNPGAVDIVADSEQIGIIVNCAGYTNVDKAEDDLHLADMLNRQLPANLCATAKRRNALLIHISTDYVFGGDASAPIPEDALPAPLGVYGATKLAGEKAVLDSGCRHIIIRTAWLYSVYGRNFLKTMFSLTSERPEIRVVNDQKGTPTYAPDLAEFIVGVIDGGMTDAEGVYNFTDEGECTWFEFAEEINRLAGHLCKVTPCRTEEYPTRARRPRYSVLDKTAVKAAFGIALPHWKESLEKGINILQG